jgi:hypothetical protein
MDSSDKLIAHLNDLQVLYKEVKEAIILAENFDPEHDVYLSPLNELRNTLDHVMRSLSDLNQIDHEFHEAKEHLYRAGYDAYEVLTINVGDKIIESVEKYESDITSQIFPIYYTEIKPRLVTIKSELAKTRSEKRVNAAAGIESFLSYKERTLELISHLNMCSEHIPSLETETQKKERARKNKIRSDIKTGIWIGVIAGIISTIIGLYLYDSFVKKSEPTTIISTSPENTNKK